MYKVKELLESGVVQLEVLSEDYQENVNLIKVLYDNFTMQDEQALEIDELMYEVLSNMEINQPEII